MFKRKPHERAVNFSGLFHKNSYEVIDWLIDYFLFYVQLRNTSLLWRRHQGLQNLGLCSAIRAFEQGGIFIVPHLL
jgi:hypothetical protein